MTENPNPLKINEYTFKAKKSTVTFDDLPDEMVAEVVSKLDLINRLKSRRVCSRMLHANPEMSPKIGRFGVTVGEGEIELEYDGESVKYKKNENGENTIRKRFHSAVPLSEDYMKTAIDDFGISLEIPKFRIKLFDITIGNYNGSNEVFQLLKKNFSNRVIHVEETFLRAESYEMAVQILAMFKPRILKEAYVSRDDGHAKPGDISELVAMEQFKLAKTMHIILLIKFDASLIFENFRHFRDFRIRVHSMSVDQIVRLREMIISEFDSTHFKECLIHIDKDLTIADFESIRGALGIAEDAKHEIVHRYGFPNCNGAYLEFEIAPNMIHAERKSGEKVN